MLWKIISTIVKLKTWYKLGQYREAKRQKSFLVPNNRWEWWGRSGSCTSARNPASPYRIQMGRSFQGSNFQEILSKFSERLENFFKKWENKFKYKRNPGLSLSVSNASPAKTTNTTKRRRRKRAKIIDLRFVWNFYTCEARRQGSHNWESRIRILNK